MDTFFLKGPTLTIAIVVTLFSATLFGCGEKSKEEHLFAARQFVEAKDSKSAIVEYKNAIQKDPTDPVSRFELGQLYVELQDYAAADKELNRALELGYSISDILPLLTQAYKKTNSTLALADIEHDADGLTVAKRAEVTYYKFEALLQLDKLAEAQQLLNEAQGYDTASVYKGLILALGKTINDRYRLALQEVNALQKQAPLNPDVLLQQAKLNLYLRNSDAAIEAYERYIDVVPNDREIEFLLTAILMDEKRYSDAEIHVDQLLAISAVHPLLNQFKGIIEVQKGEFSSALTYLETAIQNGRSDPIARLAAGYSAYQLKDFAATVTHLALIASELPASHIGLRLLAESLLQLGKSDEALDILAQVDGEKVDDALLFSKAGYQMLKQGNVVDAKAMIEKSAPIATSAEDLTRLGVLQLTINNVEGILNLEHAVERSPEIDSGQQVLGNAYIATQQYEKAIALAKSWFEQDEQNIAPLLVLIKAHLGQKDFESADAAIRQAETLASSNVEVKLQKVALAMLKGETQVALNTVKEALSTQPTNQAVLATYYLVASEVDQAQEAVNYIEEVVAHNPDSADAKVVLARIYLNLKKLQQGLSLLEDIPHSRSMPNGFWETKSRLLMASNKIAEASELYQEWLSIQPNNKVATLGYAMVLDYRNKFRDGLELTETFLAKRPDRQVELINAYFHSLLREIREAEAIINKFSKEEKQLPFVRGITARLQIYKSDFAAAVPNAEAAYTAMPNTRNLLLIMAAYELNGQSEEALNVVMAFLEQQPKNVQALMLYAERLIASEPDKAIELYRTIVAEQPGNAISLNNLAYVEKQQGMLDEAEEHAKQALAVAPQSPEVADTLAQIFIEQNEMENAKEVYDGVISEQTRNDEVYLNYIELLLKMDLKPLAKRRLDERVFASDEAKSRKTELKTIYGI